MAQIPYKCGECKKLTYFRQVPDAPQIVCKWCKHPTVMTRVMPKTPEQQKDLEHLREVRKLKKYLRELTDSVLVFQDYLDRIMREPQSVARGKKIALIANALDMVNDSARFFGLGVNCRKDKKKVPKVSELNGYIHWIQSEKERNSLT